MKKIFVLFLLAAFVSFAALNLSMVSAYGPYGGYYGDYPTKSNHYVAESVDQTGSSYVSRDSYDGPQGSLTVYRKVDDNYLGYYRPLYSEYSYRSYGNAMDSYWHSGPNTGYSRVESYRSGYADGKPYSNYYSHVSNNAYPVRDYYYRPYYNGNHWDHSYNPDYYNCAGYYCR